MKPPAWGSSRRQRLRFLPLYLALRAADALAPLLRTRQAVHQSWRPGISVVIPERDAPAMLAEALETVFAAAGSFAEPLQIIVAANGSTEGAYEALRARWPAVEWRVNDAPLSFARAIAAGLARARHDWVLLLNNDMKLAPDALAALAACRETDVFAIGSHIVQQSADGRREETGFTDWYVDGNGVHLYHATPPQGPAVLPQLCASGGAALVRASALRRYLRASFAYDPFYWEDAEWSVRAWRDGWRVLFAGNAHAAHRHRATTARFHSAETLARIVERNRLLFDARHKITPEPVDGLMRRICDLPYASQRELAGLGVAFGVLRQRPRAYRAPQPLPPPTLWKRGQDFVRLAPASYSYRLADATRPKLLIVTPFAVFPPKHGGARRISELACAMRESYDIVLVSDEAELHDPRSFRFFDGLAAVYLTQRRLPEGPTPSRALDVQMRLHTHAALRDALNTAVTEQQPAVVQIEHAELAMLVGERRDARPWVLALHDAYSAADFTSAEAFAAFERTVASFDAVTVCSTEDARLVRHRSVRVVPNGSAVRLGAYTPSAGAQILFVGPFRYAPNVRGVRRFLSTAYPMIYASVPEVELVVLGGDEALAATRNDPLFAQPGVRVLGHRDDVPEWLHRSALTINPLQDIRGSAIKVVESLTAGRICVSTREGARGYHDAGFAGLVIVDDIESMALPIIDLLRDAAARRHLEQPDAALLGRHQWQACAAAQGALYAALLDRALPERAA